MSGMFGADVAGLRVLAQQLDRCADRVDGTRTSVGHAVSVAPWRGPSADRFRQQWAGQHTGQLTDAARILRDAAASLRANANQQEQASAADGGQESGMLGGTRGRSLPESAGGPDSGSDASRSFATAREMWNAGAGIANRILDIELPATGWTIDDLAGFVPHVGDALDGFHIVDKLSNGQVPWHEVVDLAAGAVKSKGGLLYGIGATASIWADAADQAINKVDWSPKGMSDAWNGLWNPDAWKYVAHDEITLLPKFLAKDLMP